MFCIYCGKEIDDDQVFCPFCGKRVEEEVDETTHDEPPVEEQPALNDSFERDWTVDGQHYEEERKREERPADAQKKIKGPTIVIIILSVLVAAGLGIAAYMLLGNHSGGDKQEPISSTSETEAVQEESTEKSNDNENKDSNNGSPSNNIPVHSWDLDFSNSEHINDDGTISYSSVILVTNRTGSDITGFSYTVTNEYGDKVANKDNQCEADAPFYAEGFIPDGETGVMVSKITVTQDEYKKENPKYSEGHRLKPKNVEVVDVYAFRGDKGYHQATGKIAGPRKSDFGDECYSAEIDNDNTSPIHEGAVIAAVKIDDKDNLKIRVASAKGRIDREIAAGSKGTVISDAFIDPGLKDWSADEYEVCVIDNEYADGSHYDDAYKEKYCKQ